MELPTPFDPDTVDQRVILYGISWAQFLALADSRGTSSNPRMAYQEGTLELMTTSQPHEYIKKLIARLLEAWADEVGQELEGFGSFTIKRRSLLRAAEADECYVIGAGRKSIPDLAIEVVWTHGGLDKLNIYLKLGVREVWMWNQGDLEVHVRQRGRFVRREASGLLPALDVKLFSRCLRQPNQTLALRALRAALARAPGH
jgi:Uma2 family endonuclease